MHCIAYDSPLALKPLAETNGLLLLQTATAVPVQLDSRIELGNPSAALYLLGPVQVYVLDNKAV